MNKKRFYGQSDCYYCYYLNIYLQIGLHMFLEIKNNKKTICEKCLLEKNYLFIPFNQRIKQNCAFCGKEGKINAIF